MILFLMKLIGPPLFLAVATLAARRWGETAGGLIVALPLVSGPISVILALENGADFAVQAALGSLMGTAALAAFGVIYASLCPRSRLAAVVLGLAGFAGASAVLRSFSWTLPPLFGVTLLCILASSLLMPADQGASVHRPPMKYDIPFRMALMLVLTFSVTTAAAWMGPAVSGIASSLPLMATTMAWLAQGGGRAQDAQRVMRGLVNGLFSCTIFYVVLSLTLEEEHLWWGYLAAGLVTILMQWGVFWLMERRKKNS